MLTKELLSTWGEKDKIFELDSVTENKLKSILLEMCKEVFDFCNKNDIYCSLCGGSVLGAVRHKGYIPWDDDIDLMMPREDYEKFIKKFSSYRPDKYELFVPDGKHNVAAASMKISLKGTILEDVFHAGDDNKVGIALDVFCLDGVPNNIVKAKIKGVISDVFLRLAVSVQYYQAKSAVMEAFFSGNKTMKRIYKTRCAIGKILSFASYSKWFEAFDRFVKTKGSTQNLTIPTGRCHYSGEIHSWNCFMPLIECEFEGYTFLIPNGYDEYLSALYGNYMILPPEEKREKHFYTYIDFGDY